MDVRESNGARFALCAGVNHLPLLLVASAATLLGGCSSQSGSDTSSAPAAPAQPVVVAATATPAPPIQGFVRALHAVPGAGTLSLTANGEKLGTIKYGDASPFVGLSASKISVSAFGGDGKKVAGPVPLDLGGKRDVTILVTGVPGDTVLLPWKHRDDGPQKGRAKIAFVHSAKALPPVDIALDGRSFRRRVKFGVATDETTLSPGRHRVTVTYDKSLASTTVQIPSGPIVTQDESGNTLSVVQPTPVTAVVGRSQLVTLVLDADLQGGKVYSLAVFHDGANQPKVRLMENQFADAKTGG